MLARFGVNQWVPIMGPQYAGVLGLIALSATLFRCWLFGVDLGSAIVTGVAYLVVFSLFGLFVGSAATRVVTESVREALIRELNEREAAKSEQATNLQSETNSPA